jgi:hypothetical protein
MVLCPEEAETEPSSITTDAAPVDTTCAPAPGPEPAPAPMIISTTLSMCGTVFSKASNELEERQTKPTYSTSCEHHQPVHGRRQSPRSWWR